MSLEKCDLSQTPLSGRARPFAFVTFGSVFAPLLAYCSFTTAPLGARSRPSAAHHFSSLQLIFLAITVVLYSHFRDSSHYLSNARRTVFANLSPNVTSRRFIRVTFPDSPLLKCAWPFLRFNTLPFFMTLKRFTIDCRVFSFILYLFNHYR